MVLNSFSDKPPMEGNHPIIGPCSSKTSVCNRIEQRKPNFQFAGTLPELNPLIKDKLWKFLFFFCFVQVHSSVVAGWSWCQFIGSWISDCSLAVLFFVFRLSVSSAAFISSSHRLMIVPSLILLARLLAN